MLLEDLGLALSRRRLGIIAISFLVMFIATGINLSFGLFLGPLSDEFGWSRASVSLAAAFNLILYGVTQPIYGRMVDAYGPKKVITLGVGIAGLGNLLMSSTYGIWQLYLFYGVIAAIGYTGTSILPISVLVLRWFEKRRGIALGVTSTGFSFGQALFYQITSFIILNYGWRVAYMIFGMLLLALLPLCQLLIKDEPPSKDRKGHKESGIDKKEVRGDVRQAFRSRTFFLITGSYLACGFTDFMITTHLAIFALDKGLSSVVGAYALSLLAMANIVGLLVAGKLADSIGNKATLCIIYLIRALSLTMLWFVGNETSLYVFSMIFGLTFFTTAPLTSGLINEIYGRAITGTVFGATNSMHHLAGAFGSYIAGMTFDLYNSYLPVFMAGSFLVYSAVMMTKLIRHRHHKS
jgi:MFS family permease